MLFFGVLSLFAAVAITPSVACGVYPLVTSAEFGERIPADVAGAFVFVSTMFVAFYKLTSEFWRWQLRRRKPRKINFGAFVAYFVFLVVVLGTIALEVSCADDPDAEKNESAEESVEEGGGLDAEP